MGPTVRDMANAFIRAKDIRRQAGRPSDRTSHDYDQTCRTLMDQLGRDRQVSKLKPPDFEKLYQRLAAKHSLSTLGTWVTMVRSVFKYAFDADLIDKPVKFGPVFRVPTKQDRRKAKAKSRQGGMPSAAQPQSACSPRQGLGDSFSRWPNDSP